MLRTVHGLAAALLILQGVGHTFLGTPLSFKAVTQDAIWFAGAGLAMIFLGLLNLSVLHPTPRRLEWATVIANGLWLTLMVGLLTTSDRWRVVAAVLFAATCLVGSIGRLRTEPLGEGKVKP